MLLLVRKFIYVYIRTNTPSEIESWTLLYSKLSSIQPSSLSSQDEVDSESDGIAAEDREMLLEK